MQKLGKMDEDDYNFITTAEGLELVQTINAVCSPKDETCLSELL